MFTPDQLRAKAAEYDALAKTTDAPDAMRDFRKREQSLTALADNEQWLSDNHDKTLHAPAHARPGEATLVAEEEHILRCLGAALIMQWSTLPAKIRRELFDSAGSMGEILETPALRGQIARFLHKHREDDGLPDRGSAAGAELAPGA